MTKTTMRASLSLHCDGDISHVVDKTMITSIAMVNNMLSVVDGMVQPTSNGFLVLCVMAYHPGQKMAARSVAGHEGDGVTRIDIIFGERRGR